MNRRSFIALLGGATMAPYASQAQHSRVPVLGFLGSAAEARYTGTRASVLKGLNEAGFVEKHNLLVDYRWADFQYDRLPALAAELVKRPVDAIFATGSVVSAVAAKSATSTIPIVFANGSDPVQYGLVASLNRPGGNVTGITFINSQLGPKRIQLLRLLNPKTSVIAVLVNPKNPNAADAKNFIAAGRSIGSSSPLARSPSCERRSTARSSSAPIPCSFTSMPCSTTRANIGSSPWRRSIGYRP
jgi:putative ABC transport system substrate-binding protein